MSKDQRGFSTKNLILTILFIAIIVCLLVWIISMRGEIRNDKRLIESATNTNSSEVKEVKKNKNSEFEDNIESMRKAAEKYFTEENLPADVGDSTKVTLKELIDKGLLSSIKNQDKYDLNLSYVQVTKTSNEYVMKVYLKSDSKTDYNIYYYGFYDYCKNSTMCEKDDSKASSSSGVKDTKNVSSSKSNSENTSSDVTISNGSNNSNSSSKSSSKSNSKSSSRSNGSSVTSLRTSGSSSRASSSKYSARSSARSTSSGKRSSAKRKVTTTTTTRKSSTKKTTITTTIKRYIRKVTSRSSRSHHESTYEETHREESKESNKPVESREESKESRESRESNKPIESQEESKHNETCENRSTYEYRKTTDGSLTFTNWSDWGKDVLVPTATKQVQKKTTRKLTAYKVTTKSDLSKPIYSTEKVVVGNETVKVCTKYRKTTRTTTTTTTSYVTSFSGGSESYVGTIGVLSAPTSNGSVRYERVGSYNWYCANRCTSGTVYLYRAYQRTPSSSTTTSSSSSSSNSSVSYSCAAYETYTKAYEATRTMLTGYEKTTTKEPIYTYNYYYRSRDMNSNPGSTDTKWSTYNDTTLLNSGYRYTGNVKTQRVCY